MEKQKDLALFIDFENMKIGYEKEYGQELDLSLIMEFAKGLGRVVEARAYADFSAHAERFHHDLQVLGIKAISTPTMVYGNLKKDAADVEMLMDIIETLLDRPTITRLILMTGDGIFVRAVTMARNRFDKDVIVCGIPGTVSEKLIRAASQFVPLKISREHEKERKMRIFISVIDRLEKTKPFLTRKYLIDRLANDEELKIFSEVKANEIFEWALRNRILNRVDRLDEVKGRTFATFRLNQEIVSRL
jgi:uncharacterized LabA/DUF88 family protein